MAAIAAISQYLQLRFSLASQPAVGGATNPAAAMTKQMRYLMPVMIFILAFRFPAAISTILGNRKFVHVRPRIIRKFSS